MTTTGRTTLCSSKRVIAAGSASRTLVSSTYVRRPWDLTTQTPWTPGRKPGAGQDTDVSDGPGLALEGPSRPFGHLACTQSAKPGDSRALPADGAVPPTTNEGTREGVPAKAPPGYGVYSRAVSWGLTSDNAPNLRCRAA